MDALADMVAGGAGSDKLPEACWGLLRQLEAHNMEAHNMKEEPVI
jgi:hypothetical protein